MFLNFHDAVMHDEPIVATVRQSFENMLVVMQALESGEQGHSTKVTAPGVPPAAGGVPLWRPRGMSGLFDGLSCQVVRVSSPG
jgi:hypothetical protein